MSTTFKTNAKRKIQWEKNNTASMDGGTISKVIKYVIGILGEKREN